MTDGPMQMLYACDNVRTVRHGAKINTPPMKAFRAPGFVEGTFGLECLIDELAAKLELDPLELRRKNYASSNDGKPYSSKNLMRVLRRSRRSTGTAATRCARARPTRGSTASAWRRRSGTAAAARRRTRGRASTSDGRVTVVTAMQDIGTGTRTAMAQIAAEELGVPLDRVEVVLGDTRARPVRDALRRLVDDAVGRARPCAPPRPTRSGRSSRSPRSATTSRSACSTSRTASSSRPTGTSRRRSSDLLEILGDAQILGKGGRGPNPTGMSVLTFGVQVVEVAVDVETGEVRVERVAAAHDVGRIINPLGARSQVEGGIIQGIGHTLSEQRLLDPETGRILTTTLDAYRMPTIADVPEIVCEFVDKPDEHLTNLGSKGLGEPPIVPLAAAIANAIRDATGADVHELPITREEMLRALEAAKREGAAWSSCGRLASTRSTAALSLHGGTEVVPLLRDGILETETLVDIRGVVPRGVDGARIGAGTTLAELEADAAIPEALREACRLAASPQLRNMGSVGGNLLQSTRCWYWRLKYPCRLHGGDRCHAREGEHREHAIFANDYCASAHPSDVAAALLALDARLRTTRRELPLAELYRLPDEANRDVIDARARRADPRARAARGRGERLPEGDGPAALGVPAGRRRSGAGRRRGSARARRRRTDPMASHGPDALDAATPLPRTAWKVDVARALVRRALDRL